MAHQGWRRRAAYIAVVFAGATSLTACYRHDAGLGEQVRLEGTRVVPKGAAVSQHFRVRTTAPWTQVNAALSTEGTRLVPLHAALVPDQPALFGTSQSSAAVVLGPTSGGSVTLAQPPCAIASCGVESGGLPEYGFTLTLGGTATDVTVHYNVVASTTANTEGNDFGLELIAD